MQRSWRTIFLLAAALVLPTGFWGAASAEETQGEVMGSMLFMLFYFNAAWLVVFWWWPRVALAGLLLIGLVTIPYQMLLLERLTRLNNEMMRFVDSRLQIRAEGRQLPETLADYSFADNQLRRYVSWYAVEENGREFSIHYFVVSPGITHFYSSKTGWGYYPD